MSKQLIIELRDVAFGYDKKRNVIKNIGLKLYGYEFTAIVGKNGSGKTTLGKLMVGILKPSIGEVLICGQKTRDITLGQIGKKIGYLYQNPDRQIFAPTVEEEVAFALELKGLEKEIIKNKSKEILELFQLGHLKDSFPFKLSQGEKKRLALATILVNDINYLILDEPTTGLDVKRRDILSEIIDRLMKKKIGMVVISHDEDFIEKHATRIIEISEGEIINDYYK